MELNLVLSSMEPEAAAMVQEATAEMSVLKQYILAYPLSGVTQEAIQAQLPAARNPKKDAADAMRLVNYPMEAAGW